MSSQQRRPSSGRARSGEQRRKPAPETPGYDKKLDGPNRPST